MKGFTDEEKDIWRMISMCLVFKHGIDFGKVIKKNGIKEKEAREIINEAKEKKFEKINKILYECGL